MDILKKIKTIMSTEGVSDLALIVNGSYFLVGNKIVHACLEKRKLTFCINEKKENGNMRTELDYVANDLKAYSLNATLYGIDSGYSLDEESEFYAVYTNSQLNFLIIESPMYHLVKQLLESNTTNVEVSLPGDTSKVITAEKVAEMKEAFRINSYKNFKNFLNNRVSRKVVHKLLKAHRFYQQQRVFVPVFVTIDGIFNPLGIYENETKIANSALYKKTIETNRKIEISGLSCYMLTHYEICKAMNVSNFTRFSSYFIYCVYTGLLLPACYEFPSNGYPVYLNLTVRTGGHAKRFYTTAEYQQKLQELANKLNAPDLSDKEREIYTQAVQHMQQFTLGNSMQMFCMREANVLQYAPSSGDKRISELELASYFSNITL